MSDTTIAPMVTWGGLLDMQVCVPSQWDDDEIEAFANREAPAGTINGWKIRKEGHEALNGDPERVACGDRAEYIHVTLEC